MTRRLVALGCVLLLLLVTAGCAGIGGQNDQSTTAPTQTTAGTTDAPTATETATETAEQFAPGVTADGVEDARALADAHRDALAGDAFVKQSSRQQANEPTRAYLNQTLHHQNSSSWLLTTTRSRMDGVIRNGTYQLYADGERALWQLDEADTENTSYGVRSITADGDQVVIPPDQVFENNLAPLYERGLVYTLAANADSVEALDGSGGAVELTGSGDELAVDRQQVTDAEFTMTVADDGQVQSIEMAYEGGNATIERTITFDTDVTDPVQQPDWYATALNETGLNESDA